jgi:hypothetical protein
VFVPNYLHSYWHCHYTFITNLAATEHTVLYSLSSLSVSSKSFRQ